jgi:hypothetical protein
LIIQYIKQEQRYIIFVASAKLDLSSSRWEADTAEERGGIDRRDIYKYGADKIERTH